MSNTLYRKYRPQEFSEMSGQTHIIKTLSNAIAHDRIGHAYLFTGPRGTGKTSTARIFAKAINCKDRKEGTAVACEKCDACLAIQNGQSLDVIEIDAASNTGVDNIRDLREAVKLPPTQAKYKVYIIDEVHMLSTGAFNALLKTLEEPPAHVIFILATTELHKVPETILSRCQRFDFSKLPIANIVEKLETIAKGENIEVEKEALEMIAIAAEGGMRDAESLLSQVIALEDKKITAKEVEEILGTADKQTVRQMAKLLIEKETMAAINLINEVTNQGHDLEAFNKLLLNYVRQLMLVRVDPELSKTFEHEMTSENLEETKTLAAKTELPHLIRIIDEFSKIKLELKSAFIPQLPLELATVKSCNSWNPQPETQNLKRNDFSPAEQREINQPSAPSKPEPIQATTKPTPVSQAQYDTKATSQNNAPVIPSEAEPRAERHEAEQDRGISETAIQNQISTLNETDIDPNIELSLNQIKMSWGNFLQIIKTHHHSLHAFLANCYPVKTDGNLVSIACKFGFYKDKFNELENRLTIEEVLGNILGSKIKILAVTEEELGIPRQDLFPAETAPSEPEKPAETANLLENALNLLGGKIVEE